jgi:hypothetical protein
MCFIIATKCLVHKTVVMDELTYCDEGLTGILCMDQELGSKSMDLIVLNGEGRYAINLLNVIRTHEQDGYCEECTIKLAQQIMCEEEDNFITRDDLVTIH